MINWVNVGLARAYFAHVLVAQLGLLQIIATRQGWTGLAWLDYRRRPWLGIGLGALLLLGSHLGFYGFRRDILTPGPAGAELTLLFCGAGLLSVLVTLGLAELRRGLVCASQRQASLRSRYDCFELTKLELAAEETVEWGATGRVTFGAFSGLLFLPAPTEVPLPAICLVPGPFTGKAMVYAVTHDLVSAGFIVLLVEPDQATLTYPEVLAVVPTALSYLKHLPQIDRDRFGALGFDVGADLVIRAASTDERVKALAAIGPLFRPQEQGLALLSEMSYSQARLWGSFRGRNDLIQELAALGAVAKLEETPTALILGADDRRLDREMRHWLEAHANSAVRLWPIAGATHFTLYHSQAAARAGVSWLVERLRHGA